MRECEFAQGHVPGNELIPPPALLADPNRQRGSPVVLVCRSGRRSVGGRQLRLAGYPNVAVLDGGMVAWEAANLLEAIA